MTYSALLTALSVAHVMCILAVCGFFVHMVFAICADREYLHGAVTETFCYTTRNFRYYMCASSTVVQPSDVMAFPTDFPHAEMLNYYLLPLQQKALERVIAFVCWIIA